MKYLSATQIELLKNKIQEELSKRCIHAPIVRFEEIESESYSNRIEMETKDFTTVPMLFKRVNCVCFGSGVNVTEEEDNFDYLLWMNVNYSYEHFGGGRNKHEVFSLNVKFNYGDKLGTIKIK